MGRYILRRLILNVFVLWMVASIVFIAVRALPGDFVLTQVATNLEFGDNQAAIEEAKRQLGLDKPLWRQYAEFMGDLARGDLGTSYDTRRSTWTELGERIPYTLELGTLIMLISFSLAIPVGIISALKQDTWIDYVLRTFSILGVAAPVFFVAVLMTLFVLRFELFTIDVTSRPHLWSDPKAAAQLYLIPAIAGGIAGGAGTMRLLRSQMLEVIRQDYIRTARAKGLASQKVVLQHALKNAMLPVLTVMGLTVAGIISGQIILENMFNIPGVGQFLLSRLRLRDFPPFQGTVIMISFVVVTLNLIVDLLYGWLDPRIRFS
jgi:peptide/nickel transport system permease protein